MSERLSEETAQFSQVFTADFCLCKSFHFCSINCTVSSVNDLLLKKNEKKTRTQAHTFSSQNCTVFNIFISLLWHTTEEKRKQEALTLPFLLNILLFKWIIIKILNLRPKCLWIALDLSLNDKWFTIFEEPLFKQPLVHQTTKMRIWLHRTKGEFYNTW